MHLIIVHAFIAHTSLCVHQTCFKLNMCNSRASSTLTDLFKFIWTENS